MTAIAVSIRGFRGQPGTDRSALERLPAIPRRAFLHVPLGRDRRAGWSRPLRNLVMSSGARSGDLVSNEPARPVRFPRQASGRVAIHPGAIAPLLGCGVNHLHDACPSPSGPEGDRSHRGGRALRPESNRCLSHDSVNPQSLASLSFFQKRSKHPPAWRTVASLQFLRP